MNCDLIAPWYRWFEYLAFGKALERCRRHYLAEVANARRVLILGDGDGRFTAEFLRKNSAATVDSVDLSPRMLSLAKRRIAGDRLDATRLCLRQGDARTIEFAGKYDLVVSHFFLDCFTTGELRTLTARISAAACLRAQWLVSEFCLPDRGIQRPAAALLIKAMYLFFRALTGLRTNSLPDYAPVFEENGFRRVQRASTMGGLLVSELWDRR